MKLKWEHILWLVSYFNGHIIFIDKPVKKTWCKNNLWPEDQIFNFKMRLDKSNEGKKASQRHWLVVYNFSIDMNSMNDVKKIVQKIFSHKILISE